MKQVLKYRKPTKQTSDMLTFAYFWRFYLFIIPLTWANGFFFFEETKSLWELAINFALSFGVSISVIFFLVKNGFKNHIIKLFYKDEVLNYILQSTIYDDLQKPKPITYSPETILKLSWSFYWRSIIYMLLFLVIYYIAIVIISVGAGIIIAILGLDDYVDSIIVIIQLFFALISIFVYFHAMSRSFIGILENGFFEYYLKVGKIEDAIDFKMTSQEN